LGRLSRLGTFRVGDTQPFCMEKTLLKGGECCYNCGSAHGGSVIIRAVILRLRQVLSQRRKQRIIDASRVPSAVLLPIYRKQGEYYLLLTRRTELVKEHKGQISFPGGVYQDEDVTLLATALRECAEEVGLTSGQIEVLGELDDIATLTSNYIISPFVAFVSSPFSLKVNRREIEEIIEAPLPALLDRGSMRQGTEIVGGEKVASYFYHYRGSVIWGATAGILNQFLAIFRRVMDDERRVDDAA